MLAWAVALTHSGKHASYNSTGKAQDMATVLRPGTTVQEYKIIELAGDASQSNVYLAARDGLLSWLIQIEVPNWEPNVPFARVERFESNGGKWVALPVAGTTMVHLARWVDKLELPFIGWQWAKLARTIGYMHARDAVLQQTQPLALERLFFNGEGELILAQKERDETDEYTFPAPDRPDSLTPASDVYALGASLKALADTNLPRGVQNVLDRAVNPDASQRYRDATVFGQELTKVLPDPNREKVRLASPRRGRLVMVASLLLGLCALVCIGFVVFALFNPGVRAILTPVAEQEPLQVTILKWKTEEGCTAQVQVHVEKDGIALATNEVEQFFATTQQVAWRDIHVEAGQDGTESILTFPMGEFCGTGGALTVGATKDNRQGTSTVYYFPGDGDPPNPALVKQGARQVMLRRSSVRGRMYFGLSTLSGAPAKLAGAIKLKLLQNDKNVSEFNLHGVVAETDPLVAVLVIDTSKSMEGDALARAQQATVSFIDELNTNDRVCVYRFATIVGEVHSCSTNHPAANQSVNQLTAEGNTALYDVLAAVAKDRATITDRQAIILLSDGADNASKTTLEQALQQIIPTNVPVFTVGLNNADLSPTVLREIADRTGGEYLEAPTPEDLTKLYDTLHAKIEGQYQVDFDSIYPGVPSGTLELIISDDESEISIKKDYVVQP